MIIKQLRDEDFTNYRLPSMVVGFPSCTFKCEKDCGCRGMCQNSELFKSPSIEMSSKDIVDRYMNNPITRAIVLGGLEPFDTFGQMLELMCEFREKTDDTIVIYSGYYRDEIPKERIDAIIKYVNEHPEFGLYLENHTFNLLDEYSHDITSYKERVTIKYNLKTKLEKMFDVQTWDIRDRPTWLELETYEKYEKVKLYSLFSLNPMKTLF